MVRDDYEFGFYSPLIYFTNSNENTAESSSEEEENGTEDNSIATEEDEEETTPAPAKIKFSRGVHFSIVFFGSGTFVFNIS